MINERVREMLSLIARGRQQWCDCLRRYSISPREKPAPFPPRSTPPHPRSTAPAATRCSSVSSFRAFSSRVLLPSAARSLARVRIGAIMVASVWEGGRRTFKSTPPQSNYRPGHETRCPCIIYVSCRVPRHRGDISYVGHTRPGHRGDPTRRRRAPGR